MPQFDTGDTHGWKELEITKDPTGKVTNAEVTLQTVVAVRDRVIAAYQEILRMPI